MARRVIGLDVGTFSVKVVHLEARARATEFDVVAYTELPIGNFVDAQSEKTEQDLQVDALIDLKRREFLDGSWVVTGLPSIDAQIRSLEVPFSNAKKIEAVLGGLLDAHLPFSVDNLIYSWFPIAEKGEGSQVLVGFTRRDAVAQLLAQLRRAEVDPRFVTLKAAALYDLLVHVAHKEAEADSLFAVVDIGHKSTGVCVGDKKSMRFARSVSRGGFHVTQTLAQKLGVPFADAEKMKIGAAELNDAMREAYYPIARELRQTILAMEAESHQKVKGIFLVGGGSKAKGLEEFLAGLLATPVSLVSRFTHFRYVPEAESAPQSDHAPSAEAGLALSYAALGESISRKQPRFNFRKEEFSFTGELNYMRQRTKALALWAGVIVLMIFVWGGVRNTVLSWQLSDLKEKEQQTCSTILGQKIESASKCLSMMQDAIVGQGDLGIPEWSAADVYLELAKAIPPNVKLKITDLDVSGVKIRFSAETSSFDAVEQVVAAMNQSHCLSKNEKSRTRQTQTGSIQFQIDSEVNCGKVNEPQALTMLQSPRDN